jgi:hypothetical protein
MGIGLDDLFVDATGLPAVSEDRHRQGAGNNHQGVQGLLLFQANPL